MTADDSHKLIGYNRQYDSEFIPLPYYVWDERPETVELTQDECATAIHLSGGHLVRAAGLLRTALHRVNRLVRHSPRLQRVQAEAADLTVIRAYGEYIDALGDSDARRREWGATKVMQSRAAMGSIFAPAPPGNIQSSVTVSDAREIVFRWKSPVTLTDETAGDGS